MRKILLSLLSISAVAVLAFGASQAFFSDTETSTGNTFTAGAIDLKIDFDGYYNILPGPNVTPNAGSWDEKDLIAGTDMFFNFIDLKPGDFGEGTLSLHVYNNDAWGRMVISNVQDFDNTCTEPEDEATGELCTVTTPENQNTGLGEFRENLTFYAWLDQGATKGFQNGNSTPPSGFISDPGEGDNIRQDATEPLVILPGTIDEAGEIHEFWPALAALYTQLGCTDTDGNTGYGECHGIAQDGRLVGSTTYYMGIRWDLPSTVDNIAQTDSLVADIRFDVVQHRNNPATPNPTF